MEMQKNTTLNSSPETTPGTPEQTPGVNTMETQEYKISEHKTVKTVSLSELVGRRIYWYKFGWPSENFNYEYEDALDDDYGEDLNRCWLTKKEAKSAMKWNRDIFAHDCGHKPKTVKKKWYWRVESELITQEKADKPYCLDFQDVETLIDNEGNELYLADKDGVPYADLYEPPVVSLR